MRGAAVERHTLQLAPPLGVRGIPVEPDAAVLAADRKVFPPYGVAKTCELSLLVLGEDLGVGERGPLVLLLVSLELACRQDQQSVHLALLKPLLYREHDVDHPLLRVEGEQQLRGLRIKHDYLVLRLRVAHADDFPVVGIPAEAHGGGVRKVGLGELHLLLDVLRLEMGDGDGDRDAMVPPGPWLPRGRGSLSRHARCLRLALDGPNNTPPPLYDTRPADPGDRGLARQDHNGAVRPREVDRARQNPEPLLPTFTPYVLTLVDSRVVHGQAGPRGEQYLALIDNLHEPALVLRDAKSRAEGRHDLGLVRLELHGRRATDGDQR